ncbi:microtubule associated protein [Favolaschia claudopus]|uniref:Microtubule associated protein n=1 Tax=Favolaschia claudopus TaxID=2862362 RepID=A0AAW0APP1_9AGAR
MASRGTDNLRCYLREATLPPMANDPNAPQMPPAGHKSHQNHLKVRPQSWRRLENIFSFEDKSMAIIVSSWIDAHIPETSLGVEDEDPVTGERLAVPGPAIFDIPYQKERRPSDIIRLIPWLDNLPLMTVQRVVHLLYPATRRWGFFYCDESNNDRNLLQYFMWSLLLPPDEMDPETLAEIGPKSILIAFQPPWILSDQDIKEFSECRSFPPFRVPGNAFPTPLESRERLWGKIWDACVAKNTPWFVLTSYNKWVFGAFSEGWTAAFVTPVYAFDAVCPTVLEWLTFWVASAMRLRGWRSIPKVPEPVSLGPVLIPAIHNANFATPANSESNWEGKSQDAATSAHARSMSPVFTDGGLPGLEIRPIHQIVQEWMQKKVDSNGAAPDIPSRAQSPARNDIFEQTLTRHGDWLV